ncbi:MAG: signal peptidase I [Neisseriaceae bacterium]|nr:signal peptidase I [Neisseriaceae bacterium]
MVKMICLNTNIKHSACLKPSGRLKLKLFALIVFAVMLFAAKHYLPQYGVIYYSKTDCLQWNWFFWNKSKSLKNLKRGDIIVGKAVKMQPFLADGETIGKQVMGMAGDTVEIKNGVLSVNGQVLGNTEYGSKRLNKPKNYWDTQYTLKDGELFLYGTAENSYDSRYWGAYPQTHLMGILTPLF